ncbi:riboflavin biosynthesis protein RibF [Sulfobacillus thermosulfidooxidans]|uniref:riboflavin biosynthesis protein RibF n=1 Tax=Sulfobacillus thermosulfidooxidans TaxID=28034 RepID=UPI00096BBD0E|nr:riboflavin biosynthesis protein RibF [Sulfobacillus thermosulfidooxidans]OLZ12947.1 riboflavin biosynthesis protein RibF [Sulfobacillus thermosulfidooxidans]OLZ21748.1 riboflavin biosynthesis protein RibF [Sulfobacillus thermosulfidooxidans]
MELLTGPGPGVSTVVIIGNFDGVHLGHQALIHQAKEIGAMHGLPVVALTFDPHPSLVLRPNPPKHYLITPRDLKLHWLDHYGVDFVRVLSFDHNLAMVPPMAFLALEVQQKLQAQAVVVGYNFTFGAGGLGTAETLKQWGAASHVKVRIVEPVNADSVVVSSSAIREHISQRQIDKANELLGHPFSVQSVVYHGEGRGSTIGIPTLNLLPVEQQIMPPFGVYAGYVTIGEANNALLPAVANWGIRPTFGGHKPVLEVHVIDQTLPDLHDNVVRFDFQQALRSEQKFESVDELIRQIHYDVDRARQLL